MNWNLEGGGFMLTLKMLVVAVRVTLQERVIHFRIPRAWGEVSTGD